MPRTVNRPLTCKLTALSINNAAFITTFTKCYSLFTDNLYHWHSFDEVPADYVFGNILSQLCTLHHVIKSLGELMSVVKSTGYHTVYEAIGAHYRHLLETNNIPRNGENPLEINLSESKGIIRLFPEIAAESQVFWFCDFRSPRQLRQLPQQVLLPALNKGFSWQLTSQQHQVDKQSVITLSKHIPGAILAAGSSKNAAQRVYLYGVELTGGYCDLDRMQRQIHRLINPDDIAVVASYYPYDPQNNGQHGWVSPRHLYGDIATAKLPWHDVVACWQLDTQLLLTREVNIGAGVRIKAKTLTGEKEIGYQSMQAKTQLEGWLSHWSDNEYYSTAGIIKLKGKAPENAIEAESCFYREKAADNLVTGDCGNEMTRLELVSRDEFTDGFEYKA